ncbi:MAG: HD domain-containing protein [Actinobacteria bacterium]|nr:HD domain-containing protein [Actinomycetota bacterium]
MLIVDKDKNLINTIKDYLEQAGYEVETAYSGHEAISKLSSRDFDLVICDVDLGDLRGFELKEIISKEYYQVPFIFMSSFADMDVLVEILRSGAESFLLKPFKLSLMKQRIEQVLENETLKKEILNLKLLLSLNSFSEEISKKDSIDEAIQVLKLYLEKFCNPDMSFLCVTQKSKIDNLILDNDRQEVCSKVLNFIENKLAESDKTKYYEVAGKDLNSSEFNEALIFIVKNFADSHLTVGLFKKDNYFKLIEKSSFLVLMSHFENFYHSLNYRFRLEKAYLEIVDSLAKAIESRDSYTGEHTESVQKVSLKIAEELGLKEKEKAILEMAARLHDIGKIGIPDNILQKPGKLTEEEYNEIKKHSLIGYEILSKAENLSEVAKVVLHHHEWFSGKGYPYGLKGEEIPLLSRVLCLADAYHALTSDRPYRKAFTKEEAIRIIKEETPQKYDPKLVKILEKIILDGEF